MRLVILFSLVISLCHASGEDFDRALGIDKLGREFICDYPLDEARYALYHNLWVKNEKPKSGGSQEKIPKIIYQLWLQDEALPPKYKRYQQSWMMAHPDWKY